MDHVIYEDELKHYGIPKMKWGVRKYQYKDGSLTPAGRERYGKKRSFNEAVKQPLTKQAKTATVVGALLGGPVGGAVAGFITQRQTYKASDVINDAEAVSIGKTIVNDYSNQKKKNE